MPSPAKTFLSHCSVKEHFSGKPDLFSYQQGMSGHFFWLFHAHQLKKGRRDVGQAAAFSQTKPLPCIYEDEGNRIGGMSRERLSRGLINHLLRVAMVLRR